MSGPEFWQTPMGMRFYEHTLPELVRQLGRLADLGERAVPLVEAVVRPARSTTPTPVGASAPEPTAAPRSTG